jgi:hypothetical protein
MKNVFVNGRRGVLACNAKGILKLKESYKYEAELLYTSYSAKE